jgi:hypothetical protein
MGIVCRCPNGHRVKVKDHQAGKRGALSELWGDVFHPGRERSGGRGISCT